MCGIVGVVLKNNSGFFRQTEDTFFQLLFADTLRGDDATGIIAVEKTSKFSIAKEATEATWFIPQFSNSEVAKDMFKDGKVYIGHNRKATQGKATDDNNAHPFVVAKEFAMVHNGTLTGHKILAETEVDSEALAIVLCQAFRKEDYLEELKTTLGKVNGAYAIAAYDQKTNKVYLMRNKERPLAIVETHSGWFFASEPGMLYWILSRNGYTENDLKVKMVPIDTLITFELSEYSQTKMIEESCAPKKYIPQSSVPWTKTGETSGHTKEKGGSDKDSATGSFSKNGWKRFKRNWLGKRIEFWADDYVEEGGPNGKTVAQGATRVYLMGTSDSFIPLNIVQCLVDLSNLHVDVKSLEEYLFSGIIHDMEWDTKAGMLTIRVEQVIRVLGSTPKKTYGTKELQADLDKLDKELYEKEQEKLNSKSSQPTLH